MANLKVKDGDAATKYLKSSGAGSDVDPHIPQHLESNSAAIAASVATVAGAVAGSEMQVDVLTMPSVTVTGPLTDTQLRATAVPIADGGGSLTVDIASAAWTEFLVEFTASDATGVHTIIAAPGTGYKLQFQEITTILGEDGENNLYIMSGATSVKKRPFKLQGEGAMRVWGYPDYLTLPANTALVVSNSAQKKWHVEGAYRIVPA